MKQFLTIFFLFISFALNATTYLWRGASGATGSNWSLNTNWSPVGVPAGADAVTFDASSNNYNLTVNTASSCNSINFTHFTKTFVITNGLSVGSGGVNFGTGGFSQSGSSILTITTSCTITYPSGFTWGAAFYVNTAPSTITLSGSGGTLNITGLVDILNTAVFNKTTTETLTCNGGLSSNYQVSGTAKLIFGGGVFSSVNYISNNIDINGNISFSGNFYYQTGTMTYVSGTVTPNTTNFSLGSCFLNLGSNCHFYNVLITTQTITLYNDFYINNNLVPSGSSTITFANGFGSNSVYIGGSLTNSGGAATPTITGCKLVFNGTGTIGSVITPIITSNVDINTSGTVTHGTYSFNTGTFTYVAGTVVSGSGTVTAGTCTFNTSGSSCPFNNITTTGTPTFTLNSQLNANGILTTIGNTTFVGNYGFAVGTWTEATSQTQTITLQDATTYPNAIYSATNINFNISTLTNHMTITSAHATNRAIFNLNQGGTLDVGFINATRINSNGGRTIFDYKGTLTNSLNWVLLVAPSTIATTH